MLSLLSRKHMRFAPSERKKAKVKQNSQARIERILAKKAKKNEKKNG